MACHPWGNLEERARIGGSVVMDTIRGFTRAEHKGTVVPSGVLTTVLGPLNLLATARKSFTIWNQSFITLSGAAIQINPDPCGFEPDTVLVNPNVAPVAPYVQLWENYDNTSLQSLAASGVKTVHVSTATARWWRVVAVNNNQNNVSISVSGYVAAYAI